MRRKLSALIAGVILAMASTAMATPLSFDLTLNNSSPVVKPYVNVLVDLLDATHAKVDVTAYSGYGLIDGSLFGMNLASAATVVGGKTGVTETPLAGYLAETPDKVEYLNQKIDGRGYFNFIISNKNTKNHQEEIEFTLIKTAGAWGSAMDIFLPNDLKAFAEAHIYNDGTGQTDFVSGAPAPVPEPGTMMLLGAGFLGLAIYGKRRNNA